MHTSMINSLNCMIVLTTDNPLSLLDSHVNEEKKNQSCYRTKNIYSTIFQLDFQVAIIIQS